MKSSRNRNTFGLSIAAVALACVVMTSGTAQAAMIYSWTGATSTALNVADNWLVGGAVPASAPSGSPNGFDATPAPDDTLLFDSEDLNWVRNAPSGIYMYAAHDGSLDFANGSYTFKGDRNSFRNRATVTDGITMTVGDGDGTTAASLSTGLSMLNAGGTATKTYVVNSDGTLRFGNNTKNNPGYAIWSGTSSAGSTGYDTVIQIIGGTVISGMIYETPLTGDTGDYASFEAIGSTLTFDKGAAGVSFGSLADVTAQFGDSFRLGGALSSASAELQATYDDANSTFTVTAVDLSVTLGDTNDDGIVDAADYIALKANFGTGPGAALAQGDVADGSPTTPGQDGYVDWNDLQLMATALNAGSSGGAAVPEPATIGLLALGALTVVRRKRK